jgi:hypothetical protein
MLNEVLQWCAISALGFGFFGLFRAVVYTVESVDDERTRF